MKKNTLNIAIAAVLTAIVFGFSMTMTSCKGKEKEEPKQVVIVVDSIPANILPREIYDQVTSHINIYKGNTPPELKGQFLSRPHALLYATYDPTYDPQDSTIFFSDRYIAFTYSQTNGLDFYGMQWNPESEKWVNEHIQEMKITGKGNNFCCFYAQEAQPHGFFLRQSTIFSGTLTSEGIENFQVAIIMVENDGDEEFYEKNTFRILGDFDGLAENYNWMGKKDFVTSSKGQADSFIK